MICEYANRAGWAASTSKSRDPATTGAAGFQAVRASANGQRAARHQRHEPVELEGPLPEGEPGNGSEQRHDRDAGEREIVARPERGAATIAHAMQHDAGLAERPRADQDRLPRIDQGIERGART